MGAWSLRYNSGITNQNRTGGSGGCGEINLSHLFIKRCRGKREGAKGNSNLHRVGGCRQGALSGSSRGGAREREREKDSPRLVGSVVPATDLFALARLGFPLQVVGVPLQVVGVPLQLPAFGRVTA